MASEQQQLYPPAVDESRCFFPVRQQNSVDPLIDGVEFFNAIFDSIATAKRSVWVVISFIHEAWIFRNATFFENMQKAKQRGLDVRVLFWRTDHGNKLFSNTFHGKEKVEWLKSQNFTFSVRFDSSGPDFRHSHHEKTFIIDAPDLNETIAYTGGIIPAASFTSTPDHLNGARHDVGVRIRGAAAVDVAHSFAMRWNDAFGHKEESIGHFPSLFAANDIDLKVFNGNGIAQKTKSGDAFAQVQRTIRPQAYSTTTKTFDLKKDGESSIKHQYVNAIRAAKKCIYLENQHIAHVGVLNELLEAVKRGVKVIFLVPGVVFSEHMSPTLAKVAETILGNKTGHLISYLESFYRWFRPTKKAVALNGDEFLESAKHCHYHEPFLNILPQFAQYPNFTLCAIAVNRDDVPNAYRSVYVHSKFMVVDDCFFTCGSANMVDLSFDADHTELNVSVWSETVARNFRQRLFEEHTNDNQYLTNENVGDEQDSALKSFEKISQHAKRNTELMKQGKKLEGHIYTMDPNQYGAALFIVAVALDHAASNSVRSKQ